MDFDATFLARIQFAFTVSFHIIFPSFTIGLAREVAAEGIRVNLVRPGIIDTDIHASGGLPDRAREMAPAIPMQRPGTPDEVAQSVLYLLSDAASYVTGAALNVSGGR